MKRRFSLVLLLLIGQAFATMEDAGKGAEEAVGSPKDWSMYAILVKQYFMFRNLVRDAYIEVQTWKALKANWEEQKNFFERNKKRWDRITSTLGNLSSNPKDLFSTLRRVEDVTTEIDDFVMVETKRMDNILMTYEDNASVAWDVAGPYLGNRYVPADQIWKQFNKYAQDHTMRNNPDWKQQVEVSGEDPGYVQPLYNLAEWKRRNILGKTYSVITSQADALAMRREERMKYWIRFESEQSAALGKDAEGNDPRPDAIQGVDVMRRIQNLADVNDLILSRQMETQALMASAGDNIYNLSSDLRRTIEPVNEELKIQRMLQNEIKTLPP